VILDVDIRYDDLRLEASSVRRRVETPLESPAHRKSLGCVNSKPDLASRDGMRGAQFLGPEKNGRRSVILMGFYVEVLVSSELTKRYEIEETVPPKTGT
jgi:hypothetical protein